MSLFKSKNILKLFLTLTIASMLSGFYNMGAFWKQDRSLVRIMITPTSPYINPAAGTQQFTGTGYYDNNTTADLTTAITWSSSNTGVLTISNVPASEGLATVVAPGATLIDATLGPVSASTWAVVDTIASETEYTVAGATTFNVPSGVTRIYVKLWGGGGGGGDGFAPNDAVGGGGGYTFAEIPVTPLETLNVWVAAAGAAHGGGAGASYILRGATVLAVAGGGGGGGKDGCSGCSSVAGGQGGAGGYQGSDGKSQKYNPSWESFGGTGATQVAGGIKGTPDTSGQDGSLNLGGNGGRQPPTTYGGRGGNTWQGGAGGSNGAGGGGGAGYYGGGGGGNIYTYSGGGGGGGSSYSAPGNTRAGFESGSGKIAGGIYDPNYTGTVGYGGNKITIGNPGRIVISR